MGNERVASALTLPSLREVIGRLDGPVYTFVAQPRVDVFAATAGMASGRVVKMCLSYSYFQFPDTRGDRRNFVPLTAQQRAAIAMAETAALPEQLREQIRRTKYPTLFEAVRTSLPIPSERAHLLESRLIAHIVEVLQSMFPGRPRPERPRSARATPLANYTVQRGVPLVVNGEARRGFRVDVAPHVIAVGARVEDRFFTTVIPTRFFSDIDVAFTCV